MKKREHNDRNGLLLSRDNHYDWIKYAPMVEEATESENSQYHDIPEEAFPELIDGRKTILIPIRR